MTAPVFVDSNVLIYWLDATEPDKQRIAEAWLRHLWSNRLGRISFQVLLEFYVIVTQKLKPSLSREEARTVVRTLHAWNPIVTDQRTIEGEVWRSLIPSRSRRRIWGYSRREGSGKIASNHSPS